MNLTAEQHETVCGNLDQLKQQHERQTEEMRELRQKHNGKEPSKWRKTVKNFLSGNSRRGSEP